MDDQTDSLLEFPCEFPIKALGRAAPHLDARVTQIVRRHAPDLSEGAVSVRESREGRFLSVTVTVQPASRAQLDAIYRDLNADEQILMTL